MHTLNARKYLSGNLKWTMPATASISHGKLLWKSRHVPEINWKKKKLEAARIVTGLTVYIRVGNLYIKKRDGRNYQVDGNATNYA